MWTYFQSPAIGPLQSKSSKTTIALLILSSCVFSTTSGYDSGLLNGINILPSYQETLSLTAVTKGLNTSGSFIGWFIIALFMGKLVNKIGRKSGIVVSIVLKLIGVVLMTAAQNVPMFLLGRIFLGMGSATSGISASSWLAETLPTKTRGMGLGFIYTMWYAGALVAAGVTYRTGDIPGSWSWRVPCALQSVWSFACAIMLLFVPESPRWLASQGRVDEGLKVVASIHADGDATNAEVKVHYNDIIAQLEYQRRHGHDMTYMEMIKTPNARRRLMLCVSVAVISNLSGNNIISFYLGEMLRYAGITSAHTQLEINVILNAWCFSCALLGTWLVDRVGRKAMAATATILMTIFIYLVGALTKIYGAGGQTSGIYATVAAIFLFQGSYSLGITPLTVLYPPEVLSFSMRSNGMAAWTMAVVVVCLPTQFLFPLALQKIGWELYMINGTWDVLQVLFVIFCWVETRGLTLEEIDAKFNDGLENPHEEAAKHGIPVLKEISNASEVSFSEVANETSEDLKMDVAAKDLKVAETVVTTKI